MKSIPDGDEIEVSLFGPGYGEGILIHLGKKEWIVVDSCINPETGSSVIIEYLENINVNPDSVKLIVATHWHDDHIRGLCDVVKNCNKADFVISEALIKDEFINLVSCYSGAKMIKSSSGLKEMSGIFSYLLKKNKTPKRAIADRPLISSEKDDSGLKYKVTALSPSDTSILLSNTQLANLIPQIKNEINRLPSLTPNFAAVVLLISIGNKKILLGSDLESGANEDTGWIAILDSKTKPSGKACVFKVPHHGSSNADSLRVWNEILVPDPLAVLTPFKRGNVKLPKYSDIKRICGKTKNCYITANIKEKKVKSKTKIEKIMDETLKNRKLTHSSFGQIRLRTKLKERNESWEVKLFGEAKRLDNLLKN